MNSILQVSRRIPATRRSADAGPYSRIQSFASLTYLQNHLDSVIALAEDVDLNTPVTDALSLTLERKTIASFTKNGLADLV